MEVTEKLDGSSPLTRGKPQVPPLLCDGFRLIPAHAGKTAICCAGVGEHPAHPRSRGENLTYQGVNHSHNGSSPLTRGKLDVLPEVGPVVRLIPAHAGKTRPGRRAPGPRTAHPRSRGENARLSSWKIWPVGSSPLTRGKRMYHTFYVGAFGLIPAHAGKTRKSMPYAGVVQAHPRSRGENEPSSRRG